MTDIFQALGLQKPAISIFSEELLADIAKLPQKNLAVELLQRLLRDELKTRFHINAVKHKCCLRPLHRCNSPGTPTPA